MCRFTKEQVRKHIEGHLVSAKELAGLMGVSLRHVRRLDSAGKLPRPIRIGGSVRWLITEVKDWLNAGAPDRKAWEAMKGSIR